MYKEVVSPVLDHLDSETWHDHAREALHFAESSDLGTKLHSVRMEYPEVDFEKAYALSPKFASSEVFFAAPVSVLVTLFKAE